MAILSKTTASARQPRADKASPQAGIQSVEVGFALLDTLADARAPMMLRDLAAAAQMKGRDGQSVFGAIEQEVVQQT